MCSRERAKPSLRASRSRLIPSLSAPRRSSADAVKTLLDGGEAGLDEAFVLGIGENVGPVVFDGLAHQFADIERIDPVVDPLRERLDELGTRSVSRRRLPTAPANRCGTLRREFIICVRMMPGHRTDTPIPFGASTLRSPSDSATTPYLLTSYAELGPVIRPATDAVETTCPPSPCASISGPKISKPQITDIRLTPRVQFQPASVHRP